jgi:type IV pilus assembly protein PilY1
MRLKRAILVIGVFFLVLGGRSSMAAEPAMADYTHYPIFQINAVEPNILIIMDNSGSMNEQAYSDAYDPTIRYYGYFEPYKKYTYGSNVFVRDEFGDWDGNFLNWLTMRRVDVARKVIMGGLATSRTGTGNQTNIGEAPADAAFTKSYQDIHDVTPFYNMGNHSYVVDDGNFYVNSQTFVIRVDKNETLYPDESYNFYEGNIAGVMQKVGTKARWGLEFFNYGTGNNGSGGSIARTIGTNMTDMITSIQNTACDTWTPLAESYYVAMQYFKQEDPADGLEYPNGCAPNSNIGDDPYYNNDYIYCADSFVILITDGASTMDMMIPTELQNYDPDGIDPGSYADSGSDYLDDVALYARVNDLREDLAGDQNLILYPIYAFGNDAQAAQLLKDAAKNGGFFDKNGNSLPDLDDEWDADGDGNPDTYYKASDGYQLEAKLVRAINDILQRAASGTAVSVLATTGEGEANLIQAYFRPSIPVGYDEVTWTGYLHSLWVDPKGNIREDTDGDLSLDVTKDNIVEYYLDPLSGDTRIEVFTVSDTEPYPDTTPGTGDLTVQLHEVKPLWEAGQRLADRLPSSRNIYTYLDDDEDGQVDNGEFLSFDTGSASSIQPYLGVRDDTVWSYLGSSQDARVTNLINYIRGNQVEGLRPREIDVGNGPQEWKLGDIIYSTPVSISWPPDKYYLVYADESYEDYYKAYRDREAVVYVGANDGMIHAFTSWQYDPITKKYDSPSGAVAGEQIGDELWAYIPQCLLPHLKWLASPDYTHVDYCDLKPKIFDAQIFPDETHYSDADTEPNWGTVMLIGLNMGGKHIWSEDHFDSDGVLDTRHFYSSFICMDITDPRSPQLLWERSYTDLELTTSYPAVIKVGDTWLAVFGSGPSDYDGTSTKNGHIFVVNLATGEPYRNGTNDWLFETGEARAFMNSPVTLDYNLDFVVDAIYFGETYHSGSWKGKLYKVAIPSVDLSGGYDPSDPANYISDPTDSTYPWLAYPLFNATKPITAPIVMSIDEQGNLWNFVGSGRYFNTDDKTNTDQQYIFGVKDPFYNRDRIQYHDYSASAALELGLTDLLDADDYVVIEGCNDVYENGVRIGGYYDLLTDARTYDGWYRTLDTAGERVLNKSAVLGGTVFTPTFVPNDDVCGYRGESYLYGLYYETGTAFCQPTFNPGTITTSLGSEVLDKVSLGEGKASALGIHIGHMQRAAAEGASEGATALIQQSTGAIVDEDLNPAFKFKSGMRSWREK